MTDRINVQPLQEEWYGQGVDYRRGSPHLAQWQLHDRLVDLLRQTIGQVADSGLPLRVLEVGAGHGGYTEPALAAGCEVTAVEMSRHSLERLAATYRTNDRLRFVYDADGDLAEVGDGYSIVLCVSVLHHIPDYATFVRTAAKRLRPGGAFLAMQDPLWYPRAGRLAHRLDRGAYMLWRIGQGDLKAGAATRLRRLRGRIDEDDPRDMVEYHVVRDGVDEQAVCGALAPEFTNVELLSYWSNQLSLARRPAERLGVANTFSVRATGKRESA